MELSDYLRIARKNWIIITAAILIAVAAAAAYSFTRTPQYESTSEVIVSAQAGSTISEQQQGNVYTQDRVSSYLLLGTSPRVLDPVIAELSLDTTAAELAETVVVTSPTNTTVMRITATDASPERAAEIANSVAANLTVAIAEVETLPGSETSSVTVAPMSAATPSDAPVSPNTPLNLALGALIGIAAGAAIAVSRTVLDTRIRLARDIEAITERPIVGAIPRDPKAKDRPLIMTADPRNARSEAFRALRTNLQFLKLDGAASFVVTSSLPGEGKSTTALNLAFALAEAGQGVVLIDADLRKPRIATYLGIEGSVGLTDVLIGRAALADVMQPWGDQELFILPSGKIPPNPSELLGSARMGKIIDGFTREGFTVVIDAPPVLPVTDAVVIARRTSGAIVVAEAGATRRTELTGALTALETAGARVAGIVFSKVPTRGPDAYVYGNYEQYGDDVLPQVEPQAAPAPQRRATAASQQEPDLVGEGTRRRAK
ncbi:chromosome partitioning protein [Pseudoclavibacter endophyticus]|uniref:Polysaccharide biosynthesis tyrosine autokinase n=1 Tax=Pseudoclavibacter endophyticus TaxID=1778590 RepID=A0A6H9WC89_9MICO|nr:polysaccharide biosynthesis tyrosine autokinase [Pseudoclavibacter endophyticus]KAB1648293.1 polysaccharide biosynthesis tyrosine autokinase [Pseudoclavibacter endophyticus]GGA71394.1 chromosome partitioning protein [Pseudoclavibacter endophyticus]